MVFLLRRNDAGKGIFEKALDESIEQETDDANAAFKTGETMLSIAIVVS